jgi:tape measure domain-containing protein
MTDASIVLGVETGELERGVARAKQSLQGVDASGRIAQNALLGVGGAGQKAAREMAGFALPVKAGAINVRDLQASIAKANQSMTGFASAANKATQDLQRNIVATKNIRQEVSSLDATFGRAKNAVLGFGGAFLGAQGIGAVIKASDSYVLMSARLKNATNSTEEFASVQKSLFEIAQSSKQQLQSVSELYVGLSGSFSEAQKQAFPLLDITERMGKAFVATGVEAAQAQSFILQLSQAAASDFQAVGEEINALIASAPALSKAIANELGLKSAGAIRQFAESGQLNFNNFFGAFERATDKMIEQADSIPLTVGGSFTQLGNSFQRFIGQSEEAGGATSALANTISFLANNIDLVAGAATILASVMVGKLAQSIATSIAGFIGLQAAAFATAGATGVLNGALALLGKNPVLLVVTGLTVAYLALSGETENAAAKTTDFSTKIAQAKELHEKLKNKSDELAGSYAYQAEALLALDVRERQNMETKLALLQAQQATLRKSTKQEGFGAAFGLDLSGVDKILGIEPELEVVTSQIVATEQALITLKKNSKEVEDALNTGSTAAEKKLKAQIEEGAKATAGATIADKARTGGLSASAKATSDAAQAQERLNEAMAGNKQAAEQAKMLAKANERGEEAYKRVSQALDIKNKLQEQGFKIGTKDYKQNEDLLKSLDNSTKAIETQNKGREDAANIAEEQAEAMRRPIENAMQSIQSTISDTFSGVFDGSVNSAADAADNIKKIFIRMAAELATLEILNVTGLANVFSASKGGSLGNIAGGKAGGSSGVGGLLREGSSLLGATKIGASINAFGASALPSIFAPSVIGPTALSAGLGGAPAAGGLLGGAGIGLSSIALPIAGLAIGAIASKLLGGKPKSVASNFGGTVNDKGDFSGLAIRTNGKGDPATAKALSDGVSNISKSLIAAGVNVAGLTIQGGVDSGKGFLGVGNKDYLSLRNGKNGAINFNPNGGEAAINEALAKLTLTMAKASDSSKGLEANLAKVTTQGRSAEAVIGDISFITNYKKFGDELLVAADKTSDFEKQVANIRKQFADATTTAQGFALATNVLGEKLAKVEAKIRQGFNEDLDSQLINEGGSLGGVINEVKRYQQQLKEAQLIGGNSAVVELLHQVKMGQLIKTTNEAQISAITERSRVEVTALQEQAREAGSLVAAYGRLSETLRGAIDGIRVGDLTSLAPKQRLEEAQNQFQAAFGKARGGDIEAGGALPQLANQVLSLGKGYFASSTDFANLEGSILRDLQAAQGFAVAQVDIQTRIFNASESQIKVTQSGFDSQITVLRGGFSGLQGSIDALAISQLAAMRGATVTGSTITSDRGSFSNGNFNERVIALFGAGYSSGGANIASQVENIFTQVSPNIQAGNGNRSKFFASNAGANEQAIMLARQLGIPGFFKGGEFSGTGLVGENGAEFITTSKTATVIPYQANAEVVSQIGAGNDNMRMMLNVMQAGFNGMINRMDTLIDVSSGNGERRISGARKGA